VLVDQHGLQPKTEGWQHPYWHEWHGELEEQRLFRTPLVKHQVDCTVTGAKRSIADDVDLYKRKRPDSSLDGVPADRFYYQNLPLSIAV
jgi:hypothetical protein